MKECETNIGNQIKRGSAELAILSVLADGPLHGYEIAKRIERQTQGTLRFNLASLYPLLYRMERRGWLKAAWDEPAGGRRRRYYRLEEAGKSRLVPLREEWRQLFQALDSLAGVTHA
ncbi:MAG: helix-turn-helix transcriptional regulator [Terriglobia bacterium]|jgi:PadR family transcriptional regulator